MTSGPSSASTISNSSYREARGHDDPDDALGSAPQPGQVEQFAAYRAAWRDLGRPEIDREHLELSNGQLRMRVRAYDRELAAAPRYVANELAGTRQAADEHRQTAALRRAEAETATGDAGREQLLGDAARSARLGELLDQRASQLQQVATQYLKSGLVEESVFADAREEIVDRTQRILKAGFGQLSRFFRPHIGNGQTGNGDKNCNDDRC